MFPKVVTTKVKQQKVTPNIKIHPDQKQIIIDLAEETKNSYSDMFRIVLTLGIESFKKLQSNDTSNQAGSDKL
jgi:hypothetical protein